MTKNRKTFVKAIDSDVPVDRSIGKIKALVQAYGASGFQVAEDYQTGTITVTFVLNPDGGGHVPVRIPVQVNRVYDAVFGDRPPRPTYRENAETIHAKRIAQAQRTAWRNMNLLVEAALSSVALGIQTIEEVFLAHTLVALPDGSTPRMADYLERTAGALGPGVRAILANPSGDSRND